MALNVKETYSRYKKEERKKLLLKQMYLHALFYTPNTHKKNTAYKREIRRN